ncbi:MAG: MerR family transcriptional regulator [Caldilineaceae bacterium]
MKASPDAPTFNLKAVVQETGLKPDTLRAWERRYGLPEPQRTESGHRLYSQNDIQLLKWLIARQEEGMSISRAVELWRRLQDEQGNPLQTGPLQSSPAAAMSGYTPSSLYQPATTPTAPQLHPMMPGATGINDTLAQSREAMGGGLYAV